MFEIEINYDNDTNEYSVENHDLYEETELLVQCDLEDLYRFDENEEELPF